MLFLFNFRFAYLYYINSKYLGIMSSLGLISEKCKICCMLKIIRSSHKSVKKNIELLEFIHTNSLKYEGILTHERNRYFTILLMIFFSVLIFTYWKIKVIWLKIFENFLLELENQVYKKKKLKLLEVIEAESLSHLDSTLMFSP